MPTHIYIHQYVYKHIDILTRLLTIWDAITFSNYKISYFVASTLEALKLQIKLFFYLIQSRYTDVGPTSPSVSSVDHFTKEIVKNFWLLGAHVAMNDGRYRCKVKSTPNVLPKIYGCSYDK